MSTSIYNLQNDASKGKKVRSIEWNRLADTLEFVSVELAEYSGGGFLLATDFNITPVGSTKQGSVSTGRAIIGESGERKMVFADDLQTVDLIGTNASPQVNYGYVGQDGTLVVVQNPMDAPPNSNLAWTANVNDTGVTAHNNFPAGRVNLLSTLAVKVTANDRQGGYLQSKIEGGTGLTFSVTGSGSDEKLHVAIDPTAILDYKVKSAANDLTSGYLSEELTAGTGITVSVVGSDGTNKHVLITNTAPDDKKVLTSALDATAGYLFAKLQAGTGVTIEEVDGTGEKLVRITADGGGGGTDIKVKADGTDAVADYLFNKITEGDGITLEVYDSGSGNRKVRITNTTLAQVKIDSADASAGYLEDKITAGSGISVTVVEDGDGNKSIVLTSVAGDDELVKVDSDDTTSGYLADKLVAGSGIAIVEVTDEDTGEKTLSFSSTVTDQLVKVDSSDTTAGYLGTKLVAGTGISLTTLIAGGVRTLRVKNTGPIFTTINLPQFTVPVADGDCVVLKVDFTAIGTFPDGRYHVWANIKHNDDSLITHTQIIITENVMSKTSSVCYIYIKAATDAGLVIGSGVAEDLKVNVKVSGPDYTSNGGSSMTVTPFDFAW